MRPLSDSRISSYALPVGLVIIALLATLLPETAWAQSVPGIVSRPTGDGGQQWSIKLQTLLLLSSMAFLPAALLMMTCFTRIIIVLGLLRTAMGTQSAPPNQVLLGLALFLTFFVMSPVLNESAVA
jgi:flagellar biosynthetic protein FliP